MDVDRSSRSTGSFLRLADTAGPISLRGVRFGPPVSCRSPGAGADGADMSGSPVGSLLPPTSGGNSVITYPSVKPARRTFVPRRRPGKYLPNPINQAGRRSRVDPRGQKGFRAVSPDQGTN